MKPAPTRRAENRDDLIAIIAEYLTSSEADKIKRLDISMLLENDWVWRNPHAFAEALMIAINEINPEWYSWIADDMLSMEILGKPIGLVIGYYGYSENSSLPAYLLVTQEELDFRPPVSEKTIAVAQARGAEHDRLTLHVMERELRAAAGLLPTYRALASNEIQRTAFARIERAAWRCLTEERPDSIRAMEISVAFGRVVALLCQLGVPLEMFMPQARERFKQNES